MRAVRDRLKVATLAAVVVCVSLAPVWAGRMKIGPADEYDPQVVPADFQDANGDPLPIDNQYWPMVPGTTFVYEDEDGEEHNEVVVTSEEKEILGVTCTVVEDRVWQGELLVEYTEDWYAQDEDGNVWYFGESSEAYAYDEDGNLIGTSTEGSWEAGVDGAMPGILMLAEPRAGDSYRQEYYAGVAEDMAKVLNRRAWASVPYGSFRHCLKTKEWTPLDRGVVEHKYYARGIGLVLVEDLKGGKTRTELIEIN